MTLNAVGTLRHVGYGNRNDLLYFCWERAVGKDSVAECLKGVRSRRLWRVSAVESG
jgi:hypothetical protein